MNYLSSVPNESDSGSEINRPNVGRIEGMGLMNEDYFLCFEGIDCKKRRRAVKTRT